MKRRKRNRKQFGLAYWKELEKKGQPDRPVDRPGLCRSCKRVARLPIADWYRAAGPRCPWCGGMCDRQRDRGQGIAP